MGGKTILIAHEPAVSAGTITNYLVKHGNNYQFVAASEPERYPDLDSFEYFIILGGTLNVCEEDKYPWMVREKKFITECITSGKRGIGICLGGQLMAEALGAEVYKNDYEETGWYPLRLLDRGIADTPLHEIKEDDHLMQSHHYAFKVPQRAIRLASSAVTEHQAFLFDNRILGLQFHPEVSAISLRNFYDTHGEEGTGPFVQQSAGILEQAENFKRSEVIMFSILDWLFQKD